MTTLRAALEAMQGKFRAAGLDTPELDARLLVQEVTKLCHENLLINYNRLMTDTESKRLTEMEGRRLKREPVSRIIGTRGFWKSEFKISSETLDPRADSETLVESVLLYANKNASLTILDLGTGTGCLLLSLLQELPAATGVGIDISEGAIQVARQNAQDLKLSGRVRFVAESWESFKPDKSFDIVISNPPYITESEIPKLEPEVRQYDPHLALSGGASGLDCYFSIINLLHLFLNENSKIFFEIGYDQGGKVKEKLAKHGFRVLQVAQDLAGNDRCVVAERDL